MCSVLRYRKLILVNGELNVKEEVKNHFQNFYTKTDACRPTLDGIHFPQISDEDNADLVLSFTKEEVKEAVWS